jgi:PIN like domain
VTPSSWSTTSRLCWRRSPVADGSRTELALDQNFPEPVLRALAEYVVDIQLVPLRRIHARLPTLDDRQLVIALSQLGWTGLVTNNYRMLKNPKELAAILKTKLTVFAIEGVGDDPLRATGAVLLDLPGALRRVVPGRAQVFWMRPRNPMPDDPWALLARVAEHQHRTVEDLYDEVAVSDEELARPIVG